MIGGERLRQFGEHRLLLASIIVTSANGAAMLEAALYSALHQSVPPSDYEVLLVDDGSSDRTSEIGGIYRKLFGNFRYLRLPVSHGRAASFNCGLEALQGRYFTLLGSSDALDREMLVQSTAQAEANDTEFVFCDRYEVSLSEENHRHVEIESFDTSDLIVEGALMKTSIARDIGGYRELGDTAKDFLDRYLAASGCTPFRIPRPLYYHGLPPAQHSDGLNGTRRIWRMANSTSPPSRFGAADSI